MSPKEKAERLVDKYKVYLREFESNISAKQLAKMAVDEIISGLLSYQMKPYLTVQGAVEISEYWEQVKQEIQKL